MKSKIRKILLKTLGLVMNYKVAYLLENPRVFETVRKRCIILTRLFPFIPLKAYLFNKANDVKKYIVDDKTREYATKQLLSFFIETDDDTKFLLTKFLFLCGIMNDEISKNIIKFAKTTNNKDFRYWTTMDISKMTFMLQSGLYNDFYIDRKELLQIIATENELVIPKVNNYRNIDRLCIVTYFVDAVHTNSVQRVLNMIVNGMSSHYKEILIVSLDSFYVSKNEKNGMTTLFGRKLSADVNRNIVNMFGPNVSIFFSSEKDYKERLQESLNVIYEFNPSVIIDISDEYSPISYFYDKDYFTFYIPLRNNASSSFFDMIEGPKWKYEERNNQFKGMDSTLPSGWILPEHIPPKNGEFNRNNLGISVDSFVLVSVGNNASSSDELFIDEVARILINNPNFIWVLVGEPAPIYFHKKYDFLVKENRIIEWGYEPNLYSFLEVCDVLIRPNMSGGSGSLAIAASCGIPIAMTDYFCDANRWLGENFSNISNYKELMYYVESLYKDKNLYKSKQNLVQRLIQNAINNENKWIELYEIINRRKDAKYNEHGINQR